MLGHVIEMPEWVNWDNINERHKYVQEDDATNCKVCGREMTNHWFPKVNPKQLWDEVDQIVDDYNRRLLE